MQVTNGFQRKGVHKRCTLWLKCQPNNLLLCTDHTKLQESWLWWVLQYGRPPCIGPFARSRRGGLSSKTDDIKGSGRSRYQKGLTPRQSCKNTKCFRTFLSFLRSWQVSTRCLARERERERVSQRAKERTTKRGANTKERERSCARSGGRECDRCVWREKVTETLTVLGTFFLIFILLLPHRVQFWPIFLFGRRPCHLGGMAPGSIPTSDFVNVCPLLFSCALSTPAHLTTLTFSSSQTWDTSRSSGLP